MAERNNNASAGASSSQLRVTEYIRQAFPGISLFGFALWNAWLFLLTRSGLWLSTSEASGSLLAILNLFLCGSSAVALVVILIVGKMRADILQRILSPYPIGAIGALGGTLLIASGPHFARQLTLDVMWMLPVGLALCGVASSAIFLQLAKLYGKQPPLKALAASIACEFITTAIFCIVESSGFWAPVEGGPSLAAIVSTIALPFCASWVTNLSLPDSVNTRNERQNFGGALRNDEALSRSTLFRFVFVLFVFACIGTAPNGFYSANQIPKNIAEDCVIVLLLRCALASLFIIVAIRTSHELRLEFIYLAAMVGIAILLAIMPLFTSPSRVAVVSVNLCLDVFQFSVWCLSCLIAHRCRYSLIAIFGASRIAVLMGTMAGWALGSYALPSFAETSSGIMIYAWLAIIALLAAISLFVGKTSKELFSISSGAGLNLRFLAQLKRLSGQSEARQPARPWKTACEEIAQHAQLSPRETEIFGLLAKGKSPETIAKQLSISPNTVRTHTQNIYGKVGIHSRQELADLVENAMHEQKAI